MLVVYNLETSQASSFFLSDIVHGDAAALLNYNTAVKV